MIDNIDQKTKIIISKHHAIESHITSSIELLFRLNSYASSHVLLFAAWEMLNDIGKEKGIDTSKFEMMSSIKPEWKKTIINKLNDGYNALKHADRDKNRVIDINVEFLIFVTLFAIDDYIKIYQDRTIAMAVFKIWTMMRYPQAFNNHLEKIPTDGILMFFKNNLRTQNLYEALEIGNHGLGMAYKDISELFDVKWPFRISELIDRSVQPSPP